MAKLTKIINLSDYGIKDVPKSEKESIKEDIAEYILNSILDSVADAKSPVSGEGWKKTLSKDYKQKKAEISGNTTANMELFGDMLDSLTYRISGNRIEVGFFDKEQAKKADGHGHNQIFGENKYLPRRRIIPDEDQTFKKDIISNVERIIADASEDTD
jgi:hypothetical protein